MFRNNSSRLASLLSAKTSSLAIATALAATAFAAGTTAALAQAAAQAETTGIETIVVTAQFTEQNLQATPLSITAVTGETLQARGFSDLSDLQSQVPALTLNKTPTAFGSGVQTYLRGVGQYDTAFASEPGVGMYIDDVYYGTLFGSSLELYDLARVEVLRGPQGVIGGKNNIGGAIRLVSQKPQGGNTGYLEVGYGTRDHLMMRGSADLTVIQDRMFLRVSALSRSQDGYVDVIDYRCKFGPGNGPTGSGGPTVDYPNAVPLPGRTTDPSCKFDTQGGIDVQGARAAMRFLITPHMENTISADLLRDNSESQAGTLMVVDNGGPDVFLNRGGAIRAIPRATFYGVNSNGAVQATGGSVVTWNNAYNLPHYGIPWDQRFMANPFTTTYGTYFTEQGNHYNDGAHVRSWGVTDIFEWDIFENVHFKNILGWRNYDASNSNDSDVSPMTFQLTTSYPHNEEFQEEGRFTGTMFGDKLEWTLGAFYYERTNTQQGPVIIEGALAPFLVFNQHDRYETTNKSVYAHGIFHITDALEVFGGVRYTKEDKTYFFDHSGEAPGYPGSGFFRDTVDPLLDCNLFAGHLPCDHSIHPALVPHTSTTSRPDWRAGVDYKITDDAMVYVQWSTGYRTGGTNSRPFSPAQLDTFGPETLKAWEIGAKTDWFDHRLRLNVSAYHSDYTNTITPIAAVDPLFPFLPYVQYVNAGSSTREGFEVEMTAVPVDGLQIDASTSYVKTENDPVPGHVPGWLDGCTAEGIAAGQCGAIAPGTIRLDAKPILFPEWTAHVGAQYSWQIGEWGQVIPRLDYNYQGTIYQSRNSNPYTAVTARGLWDGRVTWELPEGGWQASLQVQNIADKEYFVNVFDLAIFNFGSVEAQPGTGREWMFTIRKNF